MSILDAFLSIMDMCTNFFQTHSQVVHNHHLVLMEKKPHPNWASYVKDIGSYIQAAHGTTFQHKAMPKLTKKTLHAWSMRFLYVILTHMLICTTLHQQIPSIHVDCHLVNCKPILILGGNPFELHEHLRVQPHLPYTRL